MRIILSARALERRSRAFERPHMNYRYIYSYSILCCLMLYYVILSCVVADPHFPSFLERFSRVNTKHSTINTGICCLAN